MQRGNAVAPINSFAGKGSEGDVAMHLRRMLQKCSAGRAQAECNENTVEEGVIYSASVA